MFANEYGVWPIGIHTFEDQLGLVLGSKSKIEDRYYLAVPNQQVVAVGDFWIRQWRGP